MTAHENRPTATGLPPLPENPDDITPGHYHYRNLRVRIETHPAWIADFDLPYEANRQATDYDRTGLRQRITETIDAAIERAEQLGDDDPWTRPWPPPPPTPPPEYDPPQTWEDTERGWEDSLNRVKARQTENPK